MRRKLVIIEDDRVIWEALKINLKEKDFDIFFVSDGISGLKMVQEEKPDLVLLDLILPKMHGFKVLEKLKNNHATKNIPVIILTNLGQEEEEKKGKELGAADYLVKADTSLEDLIKIIEEVLK